MLRRVTGSRFVHFGGSGRGAGWAGLIEVSADEEPRSPRRCGHARPVRVAHGGKELVFGPYYARAAAFVPVTNDLVVVFGCEGDELGAATDESLQSAATLGAEAVESVSPAKLLADELEELEAVRALAAIRTDDIDASMREVAAGRGAVALLRGRGGLRRGRRPARARQRGLGPASGRDRRRGRACAACSATTASRTASRTQRSCRCRRRSTAEPGIRSYYLLELQGVARGVLFVAHTDAGPRGFTMLCRRLGVRLAGVASAQLGVALTQTWCSEEAARLHAAFGQLDLA